MRKKTYQRYSIVILPPAPIVKKAITESQRLKKQGGVFALNQKDFFPHITLYMVEFPVKNRAKIQAALTEATKTLRSFSTKSLAYRHVYDGYIDMEYRRDRNIANLQKKIITLLNPLRENHMRGKDRKRLAAMPTVEQKNIEQFGYYAVGQNYFPHLTFSKLKESNPEVLNHMKRQNFSFVAKQLALCEVGDFGTCKKRLQTFKLQ